MIKLSIIIPVYNVEKYLEDCLNSILNQDVDKENYEVLCIDDGSTDKSGEILDKYAKNHSNIKVIHKENGGVSAARNTGIDASKGKYIWFVDSDDFVAKNCLKALISIIEKHSPEIIALPKITIKENENYKGDNTIDKLSYKIYHGKTRGNNVWRNIIDADIIRSNKIYFDNNMKYGEDTLFMFYICAYSKGTVWASVHNPLYFYRNRESSAMNTRTTENYTQRTHDLLYMSKIYKDAYDNKITEVPELLENTKRRQYQALIGALTIFPRSSYNLKKAMQSLREEGLYPFPWVWWHAKTKHTRKEKIIEGCKLFFKFELVYRLYYLIMRK